ncbi:MAG TPA: WD40 repeat domain-containing serine/threonine-protein kinase [Oculatellaceae cyanobacterium]
MLLNNCYHIKSQLSQGNRGSTLLAVNTNHSPPTLCVIKQLENVLPHELLGIIQTLQAVGNHPQIPSLLDHFEKAGKFYVVQEFVNGIDCKKTLQLDGCFSASKVCQLLKNILPILKFIHAHNVIHGDIKPRNFIEGTLDKSLGTEKQLVLVDANCFSIINNTSHSNFEYAAPEQIQGEAVFASDLYSLGLSCIQLLTDLHPFDLIDGCDSASAEESVSSLNWHHYWLSDETTKDIRPPLIELLNQLVAPRLSQRLQSVDAVIHQMQLLGLGSQLQQRSNQLDISSNKQKQLTKIPTQNWRCVATLTGHSGLFATVNTVAISPDGKLVASGSDDQTILIWDLVTKKQVATLRGHKKSVRTIAFSLTGKLLVSGSSDRTIKLWNLDHYQEIFTFQGHQQAVNSVLFTPDGTKIISGSADKTIKLWDVNTTEVIATLKSHHLAVRDIAYEATSNKLASASLDRTAKIWDLNDNYELIQTLPYHAWAVKAIAISPNGKILATGSDDNTIGIWDLATHNLLRTINGHSWSVSSLVFQSNSELISGSWDKNVKIWQVNTGDLQAVLTGHTDSVCAVASSFEQEVIVSASKDKTIKIWQK